MGKNQALFREVNERIKDVSERLVAFDGDMPLEFVCECSDEGCNDAVLLTLAEYEAVRAHPRHFFVARGHLWRPEIERLVTDGTRYVVVEKLGDAGEIAEDDDPR